MIFDRLSPFSMPARERNLILRHSGKNCRSNGVASHHFNHWLCLLYSFLNLNRQMKTTNQFDYPTAAATSYKAYKEATSPNNAKNHQAHYKQTIKQSSESERNKVKQQLQRKKQIEDQEHKNRIREEIQRKKKELEELEQRKLQAIESQRIAAEQAKIKEEQDKLKLMEKEQKNKENQENAQFRFRDALRRLEAEREQNAIRERQAQQRRKANQEAEKVGRQQAIKFKDWARQKEEEEKERALEEQKRQFELMRNGLGRLGLNRAGLDYSKTCLHNPNMIFRNTQEGPTAFEKGQSEEKRQQDLLAERRQREQEARRRSLERGENAMQKIYRQREYQLYTKETEQQQIDYNMKRIEEGKRDQYVGLKPLTLAQMEANKKIRGEEEFETAFLGPQVAVYQAPASKYTIIKTKYPYNQTNTSRQFNYSHESHPEYSMRAQTHQKYLQEEEEEEVPQQLTVQPLRVLSKPMAETRAEDVKPARQDLYYSQSEEDSSYA